MSRFAVLVGLGLLTAVPAAEPEAVEPPRSAAKLTNADDMRRKLGLYPAYPAVPRIGDVKVAVLDSGFDRVDGKRPYLPKSAVLVEHYDPEFVRRNGLGDPEYRKPFAPNEPHGRLMAQIVWAASGGSPHGPRFYLLNANGPTLFRRAVRYAVEQKVDVILFSGTFEGAGNFDGRGPLAAAVDEALAAGIVWVNAAGNTGRSVYNGPAAVGKGGFLRLTGGDDPTAVRLANRLDENAVTLTLTWNDYRDAEDAGTEKDLDLIVEDWLGRAVGKSALKQVPAGKAAGEGETKNPRERVVLADLPASTPGKEYRVRVKANTANFGPLDRVRILATATRSAPLPDPESGKPVLPVELLDVGSPGGVYPPADHAGVLTVGDTSAVSAVGPTADGRVKPDVVLADSLARFSSGDESVGSSNAAAYLAGAVAVLRATEPGLTTAHVREWVRRLDRRATAAPGVVTGVRREPDPPAADLPLTPNQQRAMRAAAVALEEKRRRGEASPQVVVSGRMGTVTVQLPERTSAPAAAGAVVRGATPATETKRGTPPHAPWHTPSAKELADLVRDGR